MEEEKQTNGYIKYLIIGVIIIIVGLVLFILLSEEEEIPKWVQDGNKISKENETYEIGDYYEYDESNNGKITGLTDVRWKVLGVNEDGNLLIISESNVETLTLGSETDLEISKQDYIDGNKKMDEISAKYAKGKNAISGRSVTAEDVNKITNISSEYLESSKISFTYYWTNEDNPASKDEEGTLYVTKLAHNGSYLWFDKSTSEWKLNEKNGTETEETPVEITTLTDDKISYNFEIYDEETNNYVPIMEKGTKAYNMIFLDYNNVTTSYWTSTKFINATKSYSAYGYSVVKGSDLNYNFLVYSNSSPRENTFGVRAVITIK